MADGRVVISVDVDGKEVKGLNSDLDQLEGKSSKASGGIKQMATAFGLVKIAGAAMNILKSSMDGAIKRLDTLNNADRVFSNMGFSVKDTKVTMENLKKSIQGLPTPLDGAVKGVQLLASSTNDLGKSEKIYSALNNGILGFGGSTEQVENAVVQLSQAFSNGKVDAETWNSMIDSGLGPALNALAKQMGITSGELKAGLSDGSISVEKFQDALINLNEKGGGGLKSLKQIAKDATAGIGTGVANMKTAVVRGLANIIGKFDELSKALTGNSIGQNITVLSGMIDKAFSAIVKSMDMILPAINRIKQGVDGFNPFAGMLNYLKFTAMWIKPSIDSIVNSVKDRLGGFIDSFKNLLSQLAPVLSSILATLAGWALSISQALSVAIPLALDILKPVLDGFINTAIPILSKLAQAFYTLSGVIINVILTKIIPALQQFSQWVSQNKSVLESLGSAIAGAVSAFLAFKAISSVVGVILTVVNGVKMLVTAISMVKSVAGAFALVKYGITALSAAFGGPVGLIVVAIAGIVSGVMYLWKTNEGFRNAVIGIWETIKQAFINAKDNIISAWEGFKEFFSGLWQGITDGVSIAIETIKQLWMTLTTWFSELWINITTAISVAWTLITTTIMTIVQPFIEMFMNIWNNMSAGLTQIWLGIQMIAQGAWELIKNIILAPVLLLVDLVTGDFSSMGSHLTQIWTNIQNAASTIWNGIRTYFSGVVSAIVGYVRGQFQNMMSVLSSIWNSIKTTAISAWNSLKNSVVSIVTGLIAGIRNAWNSFRSFFVGLLNSIKSSAVSSWNSLKSSVLSIINGLISGANNAWSNLRQGVQNAINSVKNIFNSLRNINLFSIGQNIIQGLINGIGSMVGAVANKISSIASGIKDKITGALGIHSPSRWMRDMIGKNMMLGWQIGIDKNAKFPQLAMEGAVNAVVPDVKAERVLASRLNGYQAASQVVNNTYNTNTGSDLKQIIDAIQQRPLVVQSILDGQMIGNSVDQTNGAVLKRKFYTKGSGV